MSKSIKILLIIALCVLVFGVGFTLGLLKIKQGEDFKNREAMAKVTKVLSSKAVASIVAFGEVTKISGRTVTIAYEGESLDVRVKDDAVFFAIKVPTKGSVSDAPLKEEAATFSDIKVGSSINTEIIISSENILETDSVKIFIPL